MLNAQELNSILAAFHTTALLSDKDGELEKKYHLTTLSQVIKIQNEPVGEIPDKREQLEAVSKMLLMLTTPPR